MKILYCIASLSSKGGTEKVVTTKANYFVEMGHEVHFLISDQHNKPYAYTINENIKVHDLKISAILSSKIKGISFFINILKLRKLYNQIITKIEPDVIIVVERGYEDFVIPYICPKIPKIREYHSSRMASKFLEKTKPFKEKLKAIALKKLYENQYKKYDAFVCLTEKDKTSWGHLKNLVVIPNIIENIKSNITLITERPKKLIAVGSMVEDRKGFSALIKMWAQLEKQYPNWSLHIYGDGPYRHNYQKQINELNCTNRIVLEGITDNIHSKYEESQVFVMTSKGEGLPMVILEAQRSGLPVVVYDCYSGPSDIIGKNNYGGFLIDLANEQEFMAKLKLILDDSELRKNKSEEALINAKKYYADIIMPKWLNLFNSLQ